MRGRADSLSLPTTDGVGRVAALPVVFEREPSSGMKRLGKKSARRSEQKFSRNERARQTRLMGGSCKYDVYQNLRLWKRTLGTARDKCATCPGDHDGPDNLAGRAVQFKRPLVLLAWPRDRQGNRPRLGSLANGRSRLIGKSAAETLS